jgi:CRP-like cAMP-binding protein
MAFSATNLILQKLEPVTAERFEARLVLDQLVRGDILQEPGREIETVWFPETGLVTIASENVAGDIVCGAIVGANGACGAFEACGSRRSYSRASVQIPGQAWRIRAAAYRELFDASPALRDAMHRNVELALFEARQCIACNAIHDVESRMSRTLLEIAERSGAGPVLQLTQETLAQMLGVQRTTIAVTASQLQRANVIRTWRGTIELLAPDRLERLSCACRQTIAYVRSEIYGSDSSSCEA